MGRYFKQREAIAMVELIFAIVVMGIALLSIPNIIATATKSGYVATQQESINEASSQLANILSYAWDENDTNSSFIPPILKVTNGNSDLDEASNYRRRGTPKKAERSFKRSDGQELDASAIGLDSGESKGDEDDIDDFNNESYSLVDIETSNNGEDYIDQNITIHISVNYSNDNSAENGYQHNSLTFNFPYTATPTTNIKTIEVNLTTTSSAQELNKTIILKAFSCNIGGVELLSKSAE